jgi:hypothetical protein
MKREPRVIQLSALNGLLTGKMVIGLDVTELKLPIPPTITVGSDRNERMVHGQDVMRFIGTEKFVMVGADLCEIFEAVDYGGEEGKTVPRNYVNNAK